MSETKASGGIGFAGALFLLFLGLRLTEHIDWAWYWVAAPLWIPLAIVFISLCAYIVILWRAARKDARRAK